LKTARIMPRVRAAKKVLPKTMTNGGRVKNFPNRPESPKRMTAICISSKPCLFMGFPWIF
jgi:hypothetical protein